jgi:hypothetical protein
MYEVVNGQGHRSRSVKESATRRACTIGKNDEAAERICTMETEEKENAKSGKRKQKAQLIPFADHDI